MTGMPDAAPQPTPPAAADVILDVEIERGALHLVLECRGGHAHSVRVRFSRVIRDLAGLRVNHNPLFTQLEFLPAGRRVRLLVDTLAGFQKRHQPMQPRPGSNGAGTMASASAEPSPTT
jgi:hypothetical protein